MPGYNLEGKMVIISDDKYQKKYWPELSELIKNKYFQKEIEITHPDIVQEILKDSFVFFCKNLELLIQNENRFSFYLFCHNIHEDSIDLHHKLIEGYKFSFSEEKFAGSRRIFKIILEQSTKYDLKGSPNFLKEIQKNIEEYSYYLEETLYVGEWAFISSEYLARCQLFPKSIGVKYNTVNKEIEFLTYQPYPIFFSHIFNELPKHDSEVALTDCIDEFKDLIENEYSITYDDLCYFITELLQKPQNKLGVTILSQIIDNIKSNTKVNHQFIDSFYEGLTISKRNVLTIEECFYKNQDINRYIYRPILEYNIDKKNYHLIGANKWIESLSLLTTNCFPFGIFPEEWKINLKLKKFIEYVDNTHDKVLQNPIIQKIDKKGFPVEIDIKSFQTHKKQFINIDNTIGDIDILFIDFNNGKIYICECKHNRSRFDYNNWKRDYKNFVDKYEKQLKRKVDWAINNKETIQNHFKLRKDSPINLNLNEYEVIGIFIINAPTIYMFNSLSKCYTIHDFGEFLDDNIVFKDFAISTEDEKKTYLIKHPYFDNIANQI